MKYCVYLFLPLVVTFLCPKQTLAQVKTLIAASELAFAACAQSEGTKKAFEKYMAPEGSLVVGNRIVNALSYYKKVGNDTTELLWWRPLRVFINKEQDFGFATGPFCYFKERNGKPVAAGHTFSIWQKGEDNVFKILFDGGVSLSDISHCTIQELDREIIVERILESGKPVETVILPPIDLDFPEEDQIYPGAIFLRPNKNERLSAKQAKEVPAMAKQIWKEGFDRAGKTYYRFGNLGGNEQSLQEGKFCGYFVQVWTFGENGWTLVADVMQF